MDAQARVQLWMDIGKAENQAAHLTRTGKPKEAKAMLARARKLRRRDPYTTLQKQLDEAVKKEVCACLCVYGLSTLRSLSSLVQMDGGGRCLSFRQCVGRGFSYTLRTVAAHHTTDSSNRFPRVEQSEV